MLARRILWGVVVLVSALGYEVTIAPLQRAIVQTQQYASQLYHRANANEAVARRAPALEAARRRIAGDVARLEGVTQAGETASMLLLFAREAARYHVAIRAIATDDMSSADASPKSAARSALEAQPLTLTLRGTFRDIVPLLADLPNHDVLLEIRDAQLHVVPSTRSAIVLDATVAAALYRFQPFAKKEVLDVPSALR